MHTAAVIIISFSRQTSFTCLTDRIDINRISAIFFFISRERRMNCYCFITHTIASRGEKTIIWPTACRRLSFEHHIHFSSLFLRIRKLKIDLRFLSSSLSLCVNSQWLLHSALLHTHNCIVKLIFK